MPYTFLTLPAHHLQTDIQEGTETAKVGRELLYMPTRAQPACSICAARACTLFAIQKQPPDSPPRPGAPLRAWWPKPRQCRGWPQSAAPRRATRGSPHQPPGCCGFRQRQRRCGSTCAVKGRLSHGRAVSCGTHGLQLRLQKADTNAGSRPACWFHCCAALP